MPRNKSSRFRKKQSRSRRTYKNFQKNKNKRKIKSTRKYRRVQYGCKNKGMKGGGPQIQFLTDAYRGMEGNLTSFKDTLMGNDITGGRNEVIYDNALGSIN